MPVVSHFEPENSLVIRQVQGHASPEDFIGALEMTLSDPRFEKDMDAIWDFTEADLTLYKAGDISQLVTQIHLRSEQRGSGYRIALIAPQKLVNHLARIFEAEGSTLPVSIRILPSMAEARRWIADKPSN